MATSAPPVTLRGRAQRYSAAQRRTLAAALELFADHGVGGTSLQMIADAVGVTKAAIYHQFKTREAIAAGVTELSLAPLEEALEDAEAAGGGRDARDRLLARVVDVAVERRRAIGMLQNDPVLVRFLNRDDVSRRFWARLFEVLLARELDAEARVQAAALSAVIGSVAHPFVADLDDRVLRASLFDTARRLLDAPARRRRSGARD